MLLSEKTQKSSESTVKTNQTEVAKLIQLHSVLEEIMWINLRRDHSNHNSVKIIHKTYKTYTDSGFEFREIDREKLYPQWNILTPKSLVDGIRGGHLTAEQLFINLINYN